MDIMFVCITTHVMMTAVAMMCRLKCRLHFAIAACIQGLVFTSVTELSHEDQVDSMATYAWPRYSNHPTFDESNCGALCFQITVAKKHSQKMAGFTALKAAGLPACDVNSYVKPPLIDGFKPIHMIVTTPDRFDTCYQKQTVK